MKKECDARRVQTMWKALIFRRCVVDVPRHDRDIFTSLRMHIVARLSTVAIRKDTPENSRKFVGQNRRHSRKLPNSVITVLNLLWIPLPRGFDAFSIKKYRPFVIIFIKFPKTCEMRCLGIQSWISSHISRGHCTSIPYKSVIPCIYLLSRRHFDAHALTSFAEVLILTQQNSPLKKPKKTPIYFFFLLPTLYLPPTTAPLSPSPHLIFWKFLFFAFSKRVFKIQSFSMCPKKIVNISS